MRDLALRPNPRLRVGATVVALVAGAATAAFGLLTAAADPPATPSARGAAAPGSGATPTIEEGRAAFALAAQVFLHPRCKNCHPSGDAPLQGDDSHVHGQNITRRSSRAGLPCSSCHRESNSAKRGGPPGAKHWHMPPDAQPMPFVGHTPASLCAQLKDPEKNGGRALADVAEHLGHDPLVLWAWAPGPGRTVPPVAYDAFVTAVATWIAAGGPCPP